MPTTDASPGSQRCNMCVSSRAGGVGCCDTQLPLRCRVGNDSLSSRHACVYLKLQSFEQFSDSSKAQGQMKTAQTE